MITGEPGSSFPDAPLPFERHPMQRPIAPNARVKWGSATRVLPNRPLTWNDVRRCLRPMSRAPKAHDVMIGRVVEMGRHTGLELDSGRKAKFFVGDLLGLVFGHRYATRQFLGEVPPLLNHYHILSQGGVCGRVVSAPPRFSDPTLIEPLGYFSTDAGQIANLRTFAKPPIADPPRIRTTLVVGSSMDAGKTTMAASVVHGLTAAGRTVHAGKLTGTACVKDLCFMSDAGAAKVLDFSQVGFASTSQESAAGIVSLCETIRTHLSQDDPDDLVLEIADGLNQRETRFVLDHFTQNGLVDHLFLAVHDALAAPTCIEFLHRTWGLEPAVVSGAATISPLSTDELRALCGEIPVRSALELASPDVARLIGCQRSSHGQRCPWPAHSAATA